MNPYNETIDNPINTFIQEDMLKKQLDGTGISYDVIHDWKPEYGTGNGTDSGYEDIANAKPKIFYDKGQVTVRDFTLDFKYLQIVNKKIMLNLRFELGPLDQSHQKFILILTMHIFPIRNSMAATKSQPISLMLLLSIFR